ncbi:hypothetical protein TNCV_2306241 [Trichonephila clavipes]|nr:hypothetical protein TNCV_2306241 [Trichonephila clavipes]
MAPHRPRKSAPTEYATDGKYMINYDVEEEELEPDPTVKFALKEGTTNYPKGYLRALTPTRFRKTLASKRSITEFNTLLLYGEGGIMTENWVARIESLRSTGLWCQIDTDGRSSVKLLQ